MNKNFLKSTIVVVAVAASSLGAWRAYNAYEVTDNTLLVENVEALTEAGDPGAAPDGLLDWWRRKDYNAREVIKTKTIHYSQWYSESTTYKCNECVDAPKKGEGQYAHCSDIPNRC